MAVRLASPSSRSGPPRPLRPTLGQPWQAQPDPFLLPQFFSDVREAEEQLRKLQETMGRKYTCDRSITVTRLEDLLQDAQDEKDQLNEYRGHLAGLAKRAKAVVQLKPRSPAQPVRGRVPLLAVCDYKQVEVRAAGRVQDRACGGGGWTGACWGQSGCGHTVTALAAPGDRAQGRRVPAGGPRAAVPLEGAQQLWQ